MSSWQHNMHQFIRALAYQTGRTVVHTALRGGMRQSVGWAVDAMWSGMVDCFEEAGVSQKVAADMMGLTLRTYQRRIDSLNDVSQGGRTYWMVIYARLQQQAASRDTILGWFDRGLKRQIVSVLLDMKETGWVEMDEEGMCHVTEQMESPAQLREFFERIIYLGDAEKFEEIGRLELSEQERDLLASWCRDQETSMPPSGLTTQSGIYQGFVYMLPHIQDLLRQTPDHKAFYGSIELEPLSQDERVALKAELQELRERCSKIVKRYDHASPDQPAQGGESMNLLLSYYCPESSASE